MKKLMVMFVLSVVTALTVMGNPALAISDSANTRATEAQSAAAERKTSVTKQSSGVTKREQAKVKVCEKRQAAVQKIMDGIVKRTTNQLEVFTTIADRTKDFYEDKGKTLRNYDELVSKVDAAKAKAESDVAVMQERKDFTCDTDNPRGLVTAFKDSLKTTITDLKAYRTAIKNLIVGVKSVQSEGTEGGQE